LRGSLSDLRKQLQSLEAGDESLRLACQRLARLARDFDDRGLVRLLEAWLLASPGALGG
jgi:hypothetical protein